MATNGFIDERGLHTLHFLVPQTFKLTTYSQFYRTVNRSRGPPHDQTETRGYFL